LNFRFTCNDNLFSFSIRQVNKYKKVIFWCSDETRLGLHTIRRRKLTLSGVKPVGKHQWKFERFWLYGAVSSATGKSFFWEFSHLDKVYFGAYLQLLSIQYPENYTSFKLITHPLISWTHLNYQTMLFYYFSLRVVRK
jgi:hypothetical protein